MYTVRLYFNDMESIRLADFKKIENGIIRFKAPKDLVINAKSDRNYVVYPGISIDTVINGKSSAGMVCESRNLIMKSNSKSRIRKRSRWIFGHEDKLHVFIDNKDGDEFAINNGDDLFFINFKTKKYCDLLISGNDDGIRSSPVDIEVYLNGSLKPFSKEQAACHGLEVVLPAEGYQENPKFYELTFIDYSVNNLDELGMDRPKPLVKSTEWVECEL